MFISIVSIGVMAMTDRGLLSGPIATSLFSAGTQTQASLGTQNQTAQIDYSRPNAFDALSINSGGPFDPDEAGSDDAELERQLKVIELTSDPATLPSIWAHMGKINNEFGFRRNPFGGRTYEFHAGMDIDGERGDMVVAPANGTVTEAGWKGGYGQFIEIDHGNGLKTRYGHLSKIEIAAGDVLARGQLIGNVGSTGRSTGPHLHYELRLNERPINPRRFLPQEPTELKKIQG
ncbi:MAG: M23 family metallopeptidase [Pyrinomonadaceae bacterium]